jgi:tetratricopeptide (TPR) repeat protein
MELGGPADPWSKEAADQLRALSDSSPELKHWLQRYEADVLDREVNILTKKIKEEEEKVFLDDLATAEKYVQQGKAYEEKEMYAEALAQYDTALSITPENPRILECRRGVLLKLREAEVKKMADASLEKLKAGDVSSSKEGFRQILSIIPDE